jgi:large subunit ribosomal protein L5
MTAISGQKAVITKSRKSISNFRLRQGMQVGCRVTLRGTKMYEFLDRMFNVAMPRIRDFRGITPRCFDGRGNCTIGLAEHTVFPEIDVDKAEVVHGMDVVICTTAKTDEEGRELLKALGLPFRER